MKWLTTCAYWLIALLIGLLCQHSVLWAQPQMAAAITSPGMDLALQWLRNASFLAGVLMIAHVYRMAWQGWRG